MAELKEDKLIVKEKETIVSQAKDEAVEKIKWIWWFLKEELPQFLSNWRTVPRIMMVLYGLVFYNTMQWFMALENPNNAQAGLVSVVVGAGAGWFAIYVNGKATKIKNKD